MIVPCYDRLYILNIASSWSYYIIAAKSGAKLSGWSCKQASFAFIVPFFGAFVFLPFGAFIGLSFGAFIVLSFGALIVPPPSYVNHRNREAKSASRATICRRFPWWQFKKQDCFPTSFRLFIKLFAPVRLVKWWQRKVIRRYWPKSPPRTSSVSHAARSLPRGKVTPARQYHSREAISLLRGNTVERRNKETCRINQTRQVSL